MKKTNEQIKRGIIVHFLKQVALVHSAAEAVEAINGFKNFSGEYLICNAKTTEWLKQLFDGKEVQPMFRTTNCSRYDILIHDALADTLEEHQRLYEEQLAKEKSERLAKAEEAKQKMLADWNVIRRGWYYVSVEVTALSMTGAMSRRFLTFSGHIIADSKMDAYNKVLDPKKNGPADMCADKGLIYESCSAWNSGHTEVLFLGMKTDYGYSIDAWEEYSKTDEYKQSIK